MRDTRHPIVSWAWGQGLASECQFPGTRDFSAFLAVPAAMEYLSTWRSPSGETSREFCHRRVLESGRELADAWGTVDLCSGSLEAELVATQCMVRLPPELVVDDRPGEPSAGVRARLRDEFGVEAAIGQFGGELGAWVRLSYGVYNTEDDIARLRDGVLSILKSQ